LIINVIIGFVGVVARWATKAPFIVVHGLSFELFDTLIIGNWFNQTFVIG
jgi:hypothetical protein